ncbi:unnamed protein product [Arabis nemorensis]|uniref:Reverse transcriptase zinc-binding domain-containing protein n=1 Tax=Arabis nemorensis TaxID=586526 RepID=A0A565AQB3_9BRAS|nr:unnamed protein product [Arabis nemorensis]
MVDEEDSQLIQKVRPSITNVSDTLLWIHSKDGEYSVKSRYWIQHSLQSQNDQGEDIKSLSRSVWKLNAPPKIKHFCWRIVHSSSLGLKNLAIRGLKVDLKCILCGQTDETTNHLMFQCRVSREIWEITPLATPSGDTFLSNSLFQNLGFFLKDAGQRNYPYHLFPFILWSIWKMRNKLLFENYRQSIPHGINRACMDQTMRLEAATWQKRRIPTSNPDCSFKCFVDASWFSSQDRAGIAWSLTKDSKQIIQGSASIPPSNSPFEAEAEALRIATLEMQRLGYKDVNFKGDAKPLYDIFGQSSEGKTTWCDKSIIIYVKDIASVAKLHDYRFSYVSRRVLANVDSLAKIGRIRNAPNVIKWKMG